MADVAGDDGRAGRGPVADVQACGDDAGAGGECDGAEGGDPAWFPAPGEDEGRDERGEEQGAEGPGEPRDAREGECGAVVGEFHEPPGGPAREPDEDVGGLWPPGRAGGGEDAEDRRRGDGGYGECVDGDGDEADGARQAGDDGCDGELRGGGYDECVGEPSWPAAFAQAGAPWSGEDEEAAGGEDGEGEAGFAGEGRVDEDQDGDGRREHGQGSSWAGEGECEQADGAHDGGSQDAGGWACEDDEADEGEAGERECPASGEAAPACGEEYGADDEGDVRAGDGRQVGHAGGAEVFGDAGVEAADVADDEAGDEAADVGWEAFADVAQARAEVAGGGLPPGRRGDVVRGVACDPDRGFEAAVAGFAEPAVGVDLLAGEEGRPCRVCGEDDGADVDVVGGVAGGEGGQADGDEMGLGGVGGAGFEDARVVADDEGGGAFRALGDEVRDEGAVADGDLPGHDGRAAGGAEQPGDEEREERASGAPGEDFGGTGARGAGRGDGEAGDRGEP